MAITSLDDVWVTANFKETQLEKMSAGPARRGRGRRLRRPHLQRPRRVDCRRDGRHVQPAAGDNASGNFVKVVQRVPVKIVLDRGADAAAVLRPGMSVNGHRCYLAMSASPDRDPTPQPRPAARRRAALASARAGSSWSA